MNSLSSKNRERLAKAVTGLTSVATILSMSGVAYLAPVAYAVAPADYGLMEGDVVSAAGSDDPDVYIVNEHGYKRLFLNPVIFGFYGHLGGFAAVKNVSAATRDAFGTSGLFRNCETNDEKVYGVETTGEDTGMLHWVNTSGSQAVADDPNFFKKVFCVNSNEFNWYSKGSDYTSVNQVPNYSRTPSETPVTPGAVSVMTAPGNPAAMTITTNAQGVEMLRVRLTGTGTVNEMKLKRLGAGAVGDIDNIYIYDGATRLTSGKSLSAATGEVTFASMNVAVSGTKDLSVVAEFSATAGNVNYMSLLDVKLASGTVSGLPVNGNNVNISGAASGRLDVSKVGSIANPNVGVKGAQLSEFKFTTVTEGASVKRVTLLQGGTVKPSDITNVKLKTGTNEWSGSVTSAGYVVFDLGTGFLIPKGEEAVFKVYGDLAGKKDETVILYFENVTDILAIGDQYGFGVATPSGTSNQGINAFDGSSEAHTVTLQGGVLTIAFNGPSAANIGTNTSDTVLLRYSMTAATNIEVRRTKLVLCSDDDASGVFDDDDDGEDETNNWDDLTDVRVTDEATGTTIIGPKDGDQFDDANNSNTSCSATADGAQENFTDVYELVAGKTYSFKVTGDVNTANGGQLDAGDAIKVVLANWTTTNGTAGVPSTPDATVMKYAGTTTSIADADIVPQADIAGPVLTLQASSLTLGLSSSIANQTLVRGVQDKTAVGIAFQAGAASALKVTDIVLTGYISDAGSAYTVGATGTFNVANLVSSVSIYEVESGTVLSTSPASNQLSNTTGTVTFNNLNWNIPAGATKTLGVKVGLGSNELANTDYFAFDIDTTTDVTALDSSSKTVNAGNSDPNTSSPAVRVAVANSGSISTSNSSNTPSDHAVYWGQTGDVIGAWRLTATDEAQLLEKVHFRVTNAGEQQDAKNNVKTVYLEYKNKAGTTVTKSGTFNQAASIAFGFAGDDRPYVPKDGSVELTMKADFKTRTEGATSASTSADQFNVALETNSGEGTNTFKAVGEGSGVVINGNDSGLTTDRESTTDVMVYRVFPEFAVVPSSTTKLSTADPVLTFTVTAKGLSDSRLFFDNQAVASGSIRFEIVASGAAAAADTDFTVRDAADNSIVDTGTLTNAALTAPKASLSIDFGNGGTGKDIEITGGSSKTFKIFLDSIAEFNTPINTTAGVGADYFQLVLRDENDGTNFVARWVANSTNATTDTDTDLFAGFLRQLPLAGYQFSAQ